MAPPPLEPLSSLECTRMATPHLEATPHMEVLSLPSESRLHREPRPFQIGINSDDMVGQSSTAKGRVSPPPLTLVVPQDGQKETPTSLGQHEIPRSVISPVKSTLVGRLDRRNWRKSRMQCTTFPCSNPLDLRSISKRTTPSLNLQISSLHPMVHSMVSDGQMEQFHKIETPNLVVFFDTCWWRQPHPPRMQPHPQMMSFPSTVSSVWEGVWSSSLTIAADPVLPPSDRTVVLQHTRLSGVSPAIPCTEIVSQVEPQSEAACEVYQNACSSCLCPCAPDSHFRVQASPGMLSSFCASQFFLLIDMSFSCLLCRCLSETQGRG